MFDKLIEYSTDHPDLNLLDTKLSHVDVINLLSIEGGMKNWRITGAICFCAGLCGNFPDCNGVG